MALRVATRATNRDCSDPTFSNSRGAALPVFTLKVPKHQFIALKIMKHPVYTTIALDGVHALVFLRLARRIFIRLGFEERNAKTTGLEDVDNLSNYIGGLSACLTRWYICLKACVAALWLWCYMDGEVMRRASIAYCRYDAVGAKSTWCEEVGVQSSVGVF